MKLKLSAFSAFARPDEHLAEQTYSGAVVTLLGITLAVLLASHETAHFWGLHRETKMSVDLERRHSLPIHIDMTFPAMPCAALSIDALDIAGTSESDVTDTDPGRPSSSGSKSKAHSMQVHKVRLDAQGQRIGKRNQEYKTPHTQQLVDDGMGHAMMNINVPLALQHLSDMEAEAGAREGCHLTADLTVHRVAGRVHISAHQNMVFQMLPQLLGSHKLPQLLNISHVIHHVSFGPAYPGLVRPLDGYERILDTNFASFRYYLKVVPTLFYGRLSNTPTETHQYSVTEYVVPISAESGQAAAVDLMYDISPIIMTVNEEQPSILHYLTRMCAVVGGVFAIVRLVDRQLYWLLSMLK